MRILHDIPAGARVLTTPLTYIATTSAIWAAGLEPEFADVNPVTFSMFAPADRITLPVDLFGYPADIEPGGLCIEDACEAHGTVALDGQKCGARGAAGCFSFCVAHNIQAGEMGAVTTDSREFADLCRSLKAQGRACTCRVCTRAKGTCPQGGGPDPRFTHNWPGFNFKSNEFAAAIALAQVEQANSIKLRRWHNVRRLHALLRDTPGLELPMLDGRVSYMVFPLVLTDGNRNEICARIQSLGVETRPFFQVVYKQPAYHDGEFHAPVAEHLADQGFYIGCHQYLTDDDLVFAASVIRQVIKEQNEFLD